MLAHKLQKKENFWTSKRIIALAVFIAFFLFLLFGGFWFKNTLNAKNSNNSTTIAFEIKSGEGLQEVAKNLEKNKLIKSHLAFELYLKFRGLAGKIQAGAYEIPQNLTIKEVALFVTKGETSTTRITIPEGWTNDEIGAYLEKKKIATKSEFLQAAKYNPERDNYPFLNEFKSGESLEGFLYPDTYELSKKADATEVVEKMLANFNKKFDQRLQDKQKTSGMTVKEVVILASIVEKEVSKTEDRKMVAGIFENRLNVGMRLQSDVTVEYVLKTGKRILSGSEIEVDSPYNTYKVPGLPIGAISNPSIISIEAVLFPTDNDYAYFLAGKDGKTYFAKTIDQHETNKRLYMY